jgi:glycosyltransferase involved in cell wall biosynthesis
MRKGALGDQPRLGIVTGFFPCLTETFIYGEITGLARHGVPLRIYSVRRPPAAEVSEEVRRLREETYYLLPPHWGQLAAAHLHWVLRRPLRYLSTLFALLRGQHHRLRDRLRTLVHFAEGVLVAAQARRDGVGHFHAHYASHPATVALTASWLLDVPFSFTGHAYDIWEDRLLLPQKLLACRFAVTCTKRGASELLKAAPMVDPYKVCTVYHGVDLERFSPAARRGGEEFTILSVSRLDRPKGQHLLLAALEALGKEGYRFRLRIVGEGPARRELEELTRLCRLEGRVSFAGRVYHEHLPDYYRQADLFVLPCYRDGNYQDNLPNVLLEAMACGVPVISTRMQGIPELIEDGVSGLLVEQQDVAGLTQAIRRLMDDRELAAGMGQAGRRRVAEHFDQAVSASRLAALYCSQFRAGRKTGLRLIGAAPPPGARPAGE